MFRKANQWMENAFTSTQFTYKELRSMFLTLLLDQFFIMFISFLSTTMVSSSGEAAIAAVNMAGSISNMIYLLFSASAVGSSIIIARAKGSGDLDIIRYTLGEAICLCGVIGLTLGVLMYASSGMIVHFLYPEAEPLLLDYAVHYMQLVSISYFPYAVFNAIFYAFRSLGDTKSSLVLTIVVNVTHLLCSFLFINGLQMGVTGAGLSFIVARGLGAILALLWLLKIHNEFSVHIRHLFHFTKKISNEILKLAIPVASESVLFQGGMLLVQIYLARLTTTDLAAHGVANSFLSLYMITGNALTSITSTVCGQCLGAKQYDQTRTYGRHFTAIGRWLMLVTALILMPLSPWLLQLYSPSEQGMPIIMTCLWIGAFGMPLIWSDGYIIPMTLRAAGDVTYTSAISVIALFACRIALGYVLTIPMGMGVAGVWVAMIVEWLLRAVLMRLRLRGDKWLQKTA